MTYNQSEALADIHAALSKAQSEMDKATKDSINPHLKNRYSSLSSVINAVTTSLTANDLSFTQHTRPNNDGIEINTVIRHKSGQWIESGWLFIPAPKKDPQGFGSALTYARRYQLSTMLGIGTEDDDGNAASKPQQPQKPVETYTLERAKEMMQKWIDAKQQPDTKIASIRQVFNVPDIVASYITSCLTIAKMTDKNEISKLFNLLPPDYQSNAFFESAFNDRIEAL